MRLMDTGKLIEVELVSKTLVRQVEGADVVDLRVALTNFSGTPVQLTIEDIVNPHGEESYESGERFPVRVDRFADEVS